MMFSVYPCNSSRFYVKNIFGVGLHTCRHILWACPSVSQSPANDKSFDIIIIDDAFVVIFSANIVSGNVR